MDIYALIKSLHIIAMTAWMAGMFYLPRLFAYHAAEPAGSPTSETFKIMERRLLRIIINPAMLITWACGVTMAIKADLFANPEGNGWFHAKLSLLVIMQLLHAFFANQRRKFARDERPYAARTYKIVNEAVTLVFMGIVLLVVLKPF